MAVETKERILDAARSVFAAQGFHGTTTRSVCELAEVNGAALNYHFGSKEDLWLESCQWAGRQLFENVLRNFNPQDEPACNVKRIVSSIFDALREDERPLRIVAWASMQSDRLNFPLASQHFQPVVQFGRGYFDRLIAEGRLRDFDYQAALATFWGMLLVAFIDQAGNRVFFGKDLSDEEHALRIRQSLVDSALAILGLVEPSQP